MAFPCEHRTIIWWVFLHNQRRSAIRGKSFISDRLRDATLALWAALAGSVHFMVRLVMRLSSIHLRVGGRMVFQRQVLFKTTRHHCSRVCYAFVDKWYEQTLESVINSSSAHAASLFGSNTLKTLMTYAIKLIPLSGPLA
jgi:hypothetical protein